MIPNTELSDLLDLGNLSSSAERLLERTKLVFVPYQWTRVCSEEDSLIKESSSRTITYTTPSGRVLRSADDVKKLLIKIKDPTAKICQCYLDSNLTFEEVFNFDSRVASLCLPPPETDADSGIVLKATKCLGASEVDLPKLDRIQDLFDHLIKLEHVDLSLDESHSSYASTMTSNLEPANVMDDLLCSKPVNNRYVMLNGQCYSRHLTESSLAHLCYEFEDLEAYLVSLLPEIHVQIPKLLTSTPVRPLPSPLPIPQEDSEKKSSNGIEQNGDHEEADDTILEPEDHEHQNDSRPSTPRTDDDDTKGAAATKGVESSNQNLASKDSNENDDLKAETPKSGRSSLDSSISPFSQTKKKITFEDCDEVELVKKEDAVEPESDSTDIEEKVEKEVEVKKNKKKDSKGITVKQPQNGDHDDEPVILEQNPEDHDEDDHLFDPSMLVDVQIIEEKVPDSKVLTTTIEQSTSASPSTSTKFGRTLRGRRYPAKPIAAAGSSNFESNSEDSNTNDLKEPKRSRRARDIVPPIASTSSKKNNKKVVEVEEEVEDVKKKEGEQPEDSDSTDIEVMEVESRNLNTAKGPNPVTKRKKRKRIVMQTSYKKKKTSTGAAETVRKSTGASESTRKSTTGGPTRKKPINPANGTWVCRYVDCARVFDQRSNLLAHQRIHIRAKPYECAWGNGCDYASEFRNNTTRHISEMHLGRSTRYDRRSRGGGIEVEDKRNPSDFVRVVEME